MRFCWKYFSIRTNNLLHHQDAVMCLWSWSNSLLVSLWYNFADNSWIFQHWRLTTYCLLKMQWYVYDHGQYWFSWWLGCLMAPTHHLNLYCFIINNNTSNMYECSICGNCLHANFKSISESYIFTWGQFWPSGIVVACLSLSVCVCVCVSTLSLSMQNLLPIQARITNFRPE